MRVNVQAVRIIGLVSAFGALIGCSVTEGREYNDKVAKGNRRIAKEAQNLRQKIGLLEQDQPANVKEVKQAHSTLVQTVKAVKVEADAWDAPAIKEAKELRTAYSQFLDGQEAIANKEFAEIIKIVENPKMLNKQKWFAIQKLLARIEQLEKPDRDALQAAQRAYAQAAGFALPTRSQSAP